MKKLFLVAILSAFAIFMACERNVENITPTEELSLLKTDASPTERSILVAKIIANEDFQKHIEVQFQSVHKYMKYLGSLTDEAFEAHQQSKEDYLNQLRALQKPKRIMHRLDVLTPVELANYKQEQKELQAQYSNLVNYFPLETSSSMIASHKIRVLLKQHIPELQNYEPEYVLDLYAEAAQNYRQLYVNGTFGSANGNGHGPPVGGPGSGGGGNQDGGLATCIECGSDYLDIVAERNKQLQRTRVRGNRKCLLEGIDCSYPDWYYDERPECCRDLDKEYEHIERNFESRLQLQASLCLSLCRD